MSIVGIQRYCQLITTEYGYGWEDISEKKRAKIAEGVFANPIILRSVAINNSTMFIQYLHYVSNSTLDKVCQTFGIPNLTSASLQCKFLSCTGLQMYKHHVDPDGNVQLPKLHYCKKMSFQNSGITTALVGGPGSGILLVCQLLETATGIYTGSDQGCDARCVNAGMFGEGIVSENVVAVTVQHVACNFPHNWPIIYIIRNPLDAIMAGWSEYLSKIREPASSPNLNVTTMNFGKCVATGYSYMAMYNLQSKV